MSWTEQKIQMLKDMWGHGYSASEIAKHLGGLTRNAVIGKAHRLRLSSRPSPIRREDEVGRRVGIPGDSMVAVVKAAPRKKVMLRPLPVLPVPPSSITSRASVGREGFRSIDAVKRAEGIAVTKAGDRHCRWPVGDPRSPDFRFCGCSAHEGLPYCIDHARVAYQNIGKRPSRAMEAEAASEFRLPGQSRF